MSQNQDDEHDMYVAQLQEVFKSCDVAGSGLLQKSELEQLCVKLQLEDQSEELVKQLVGDNPEKQVSFEEFKEGFVAVLSEAVDGISSDEELEYDTDLGTTGGTASPKFFRGRRRYGRRTLPDSSEGEGTSSLRYGRRTLPDSSEGEATLGTADFSEYSSRSTHTRSSRGHTSSRVSSFDVEEEPSYDGVDGAVHQPQSSSSQPHDSTIPETFEAEGEVNQNIGDLENALDPISEEEHLKEIWRELGVGKSGYLTIEELSTVCQHIGMDEMNQEEIDHLFAKLDTDGDGHVSFQEFLQGLFQHGGPMTPSPPQMSRLSPTRPLSTPRLKNKLSASFEASDRQTPSFSSHGSGLFTDIDPDNTGYASSHVVLEMWQALGFDQGADILQYLQFDGHSKINLTELSYALEQELRSVEEDNVAFHLSVTMYEHEFARQRSRSEHLAAERDKLRSDLTEANSRILLLVKEGDERNLAVEKAKEKELASLEAKYQDQIRSLHANMDQERELVVQQSNQQRLKLQQEVEVYKEEETRLREKLTYSQKEVDRMEEELFEVMEQCSDLEKQNKKLRREVQETDDLRNRGELEELESHRANILDEQEKFSSQKLLQLEKENKELKDKTDELSMEVEGLNQQLLANKKQHKVSKPDSVGQGRKGSNMADYVKSPMMTRKEIASEASDEDILSPTSHKRRFLPQQASVAYSEDGSIFGLTEGSNQAAVQELERAFSVERKDIEDAFKMEIAQLEDDHIREKNEMVKNFNKEKDSLAGEFAVKLEASLQEREENLKELFERDKQDMTIIHESEKNLLEHNYAQEKADVIKRMREEFESELEHKLDEQKQDHMKELEQVVTRDSSMDEDYKKKVTELQLQLKLQEEEMNIKFRKQLSEQQENFEAEKSKLEERHRLEILDHDSMLSKGVEGLQGRLKLDFEELLERHKLEIGEAERKTQRETLETEKDAIIEEFTRQQEHIVRKLKKERKDLEQKHKSHLQQTLEKERENAQKERKQIQLQMDMERDAIQYQALQNSAVVPADGQQFTVADLQQVKGALDQDRKSLDAERRSLRAQFDSAIQRERDQLDRERSSLRQLLEEEVSRELHAQMEDEFLEQMDRVKDAFGLEQQELEKRVEMLQQELDDLNNTRDMEERFRLQMELQSKDSEGKFRKQVEDLRLSNDKLRRENDKLEKELKEKTWKQEAPVTMEMIPRSQTAADALRDKQDHDRLVEEKKSLQKEISDLQEQLQNVKDTNVYTQHYKTQLEKWEEERSSLHEQLDLTTNKLATINLSMSLKDSEHLREIQQLNEKLSQTVNVTRYNNLNAQLLESQKQARQLAVGLEERTAQTNKLIQGLREDHERAMQLLQKEKETIEKKLRVAQQLLDTQVKKLKHQLEQASRLDVLVKELYVENSNLMKCLELSERRGVTAERQVQGLEDKCRAMNRVLKKVGTSVIV